MVIGVDRAEMHLNRSCIWHRISGDACLRNYKPGNGRRDEESKVLVVTADMYKYNHGRYALAIH